MGLTLIAVIWFGSVSHRRGRRRGVGVASSNSIGERCGSVGVLHGEVWREGSDKGFEDEASVVALAHVDVVAAVGEGVAVARLVRGTGRGRKASSLRGGWMGWHLCIGRLRLGYMSRGRVPRRRRGSQNETAGDESETSALVVLRRMPRFEGECGWGVDAGRCELALGRGAKANFSCCWR